MIKQWLIEDHYNNPPKRLTDSEVRRSPMDHADLPAYPSEKHAVLNKRGFRNHRKDNYHLLSPFQLRCIVMSQSIVDKESEVFLLLLFKQSSQHYVVKYEGEISLQASIEFCVQCQGTKL